MLYSVSAFVMVTGSLGCIGFMRLDGTEKMQATWNGATLAPFLVHGCLSGIFWVRCVSSDSSQEHTFFIVQLVWTLIAAVGQGLLIAHKRLLKNFGFHLLMCAMTMVLIFMSIGVHVTVTMDLHFFQTCPAVDVEKLFADEDGTGEEKIDNVAYDPSAAWGNRECVIDEQCGYTEQATYGFVSLLMLITCSVIFCLRGCRIKDFPKSINSVTIGLWFTLTLVVMSFWIGCGSTDTSVEKPFWVTLLVSSVILTVALSCYGVSLVDIEPKGFDVGIKIQVGVSLTVVAVSAMLVHITVSNGDNFLAECQVYERCHWWQEGMTPAVDCSEYWDRLRYASEDDCATTRCNGHGLCVGFRLTGGCKCTPSFTGRYCDEYIPVNTNKASVDIVFGLEGIVDEADIIAIEGGEEPVGEPVYWPNLAGLGFDISHIQAQQHIADMCDSLAALDDVLQVQSLMCFMTDFRDWVLLGCPGDSASECPCGGDGEDRACSFPVPPSAFLNTGRTGGLLKTWLALDGGKYFRHIGFERHPTQGHATRVSFARISVYTKLSKQEPGFSALPTFNRIENFVAQWNERADEGRVRGLAAYPAYQTSKLWIKMFTEVSAVNGIVYAIIIIAFCSFFTIFVFTGHVRMAIIVVTNVFAMLCTILGYFKAAGWSMGIVEAVSALVLLGSSVDYSLHVAEAFVDCSQHNRVSADPMGRSALVTQALTKIGVSVLHAAGTTFLSVLCLLFCTVTLFVKFGQIILVSVFVSIAFALMPLPSALGLLGPKRFRRSFKRQVFMLLSLTVLGLMSLMVVYSMDASGQINVVGPAGEPLFGRKIRVENGAFGDEV
eukprot:COSAG02_NODE_2535_length_8585_cov_3.664624_3_plen_830_part_00